MVHKYPSKIRVQCYPPIKGIERDPTNCDFNSSSSKVLQFPPNATSNIMELMPNPNCESRIAESPRCRRQIKSPPSSSNHTPSNPESSQKQASRMKGV